MSYIPAGLPAWAKCKQQSANSRYLNYQISILEFFTRRDGHSSIWCNFGLFTELSACKLIVRRLGWNLAQGRLLHAKFTLTSAFYEIWEYMPLCVPYRGVSIARFLRHFRSLWEIPSIYMYIWRLTGLNAIAHVLHDFDLGFILFFSVVLEPLLYNSRYKLWTLWLLWL